MDKDAINYKKLQGKSGKPKTDIAVYLGRKRVGTIQKVKLGFQYFPKGRKEGGDVYVSAEQVKRSLELPSEEE